MTAAVTIRAAPRAAPGGPRPRRSAPPAAAAVRLPISPRRLRRLVGWGVVALVMLASAGALWAAGVPARLADRALALTVAHGFEVRTIDIHGLKNQPKAAVRAAILADATTAMLAIDPAAIRARLRALRWVDDATVARRFPDRLEVTIVERRPAALWQLDGQKALIDAGGHVLVRDGLARFRTLPMVVGEGANTEMASLEALVATAPRLGPRIDSATWVGRRRWDLRMTTGEIVSLPEGYGRAEAALATFARLDAKRALLGRGFVRFDLRLPDRMVVRVSDTPGSAAIDVRGVAI